MIPCSKPVKWWDDELTEAMKGRRGIHKKHTSDKIDRLGMNIRPRENKYEV